jgi:hypothetical protein
MKSKIKMCLITGWLTAAFLILFMGTNLCASTDEACFAAGESMFLFMFLLSFPTGIVFFILSMFFLESESIHYPSDYMIAWLIMTCGGCLQWFIVVPRLFERRTLTILNLKQDEKSSGSLPVDLHPARVRSAKRLKRISPFDKNGRTPLERVFNQRL